MLPEEPFERFRSGAVAVDPNKDPNRPVVDARVTAPSSLSEAADRDDQAQQGHDDGREHHRLVRNDGHDWPGNDWLSAGHEWIERGGSPGKEDPNADPNHPGDQGNGDQPSRRGEIRQWNGGVDLDRLIRNPEISNPLQDRIHRSDRAQEAEEGDLPLRNLRNTPPSGGGDLLRVARHGFSLPSPPTPKSSERTCWPAHKAGSPRRA